MLSSDYREKCNCIKYEQERTGNSEKVAHHEVCRPHCLQFRKAVKYVESVPACLFYFVVYVNSERLKSVGKRHLYGPDLGAVFYKWLMTCKAEIYYISSVSDSLPEIELHKQLKFREFGNSPHNIVAEPYIIKCGVHFGYSRTNPVKCSHSDTSLVLQIFRITYRTFKLVIWRIISYAVISKLFIK